VLDRRVTFLADPDDPEARQPYHAGLDTHESRAAKAVKRLVKAVERFAHRSVAGLIAEYRAAGHRVRGAGIVVGSLIDPASIANDHIRAHAEEGRLFRVVVEQAVRKCRLPVRVLRERELYAAAARVLRVPAGRLRKQVAVLGEIVDGPWRAEEKAAALAAWMVLR
jgi:acetylornithine/succinyldiaminopimelate/putrescine aminotransferase